MNRYIIICYWHFSTIHIVKVVKDSLLKNNGKSIFILVDICIEKRMDIGQSIFHTGTWLKMKILYLKRLSGKCFFFASRFIKEVEEFWLLFF